jgi:CRP-like cAMP-binding protein
MCQPHKGGAEQQRVEAEDDFEAMDLGPTQRRTIRRRPSESGSAASSSGRMARFGSRSTSRGREVPARDTSRSRNPSPAEVTGSRLGSVGRPGSGRSSSISRSDKSEDELDVQPPATLYKAKWSNFELFRGLSKQDMNSCIARMKVKTFKAGDVIIRKGTIGTTMYFIDLGTAMATVRGQVASELKSGDYFGEMAFIATCQKFLKLSDEGESQSQAVRAADVMATSSTRMLEFSVKDFLSVLKDNLNGNRAVLKALTASAAMRKANITRIERNIQQNKDRQGSVPLPTACAHTSTLQPLPGMLAPLLPPPSSLLHLCACSSTAVSVRLLVCARALLRLIFCWIHSCGARRNAAADAAHARQAREDARYS